MLIGASARISTPAAYQFEDRYSFHNCQENKRKAVDGETQIKQDQEYYFQNSSMECNRTSKLMIDQINTVCNYLMNITLSAMSGARSFIPWGGSS